MLPLLFAYLCVPRRLRFILRWLAACLFLVVVGLVLILFYRILLTVPKHHGWILHPRPHQPLSPDFIRDDANQHYHPKEIL
jgi:hypothetical protein